MAGKEPVVYAVVVNYNGWRDTIACLESLLRSTYQSLRVIVCDNGSSDGSLGRIADWAVGREPAHITDAANHLSIIEPPVTKPVAFGTRTRAELDEHGFDWKEARLLLTDCKANLGFAAANNVALRHVLRTDPTALVWLINNDTVVASDALGEMVRTLQADQSLGAVGATVLRYAQPMSVETHAGASISRWSGTTRMALGSPARLDFVSGCCLLARTETIVHVGLLDERFFLYGEDADWGLRMTREGYRLSHCSTARIWHKGGASASHRSPLHDYNDVKGALMLIQKHHPARLPVAMGYSIFRCVLPKLVRGEWNRLAAVLRSYRDFFRPSLRSVLSVFASLAILSVVAACDPCFGVVGCTVAPRIAVMGQLLDQQTGLPVRGASIDFVRKSGASLTPDSVRAITGADGLFSIEAEAGGGGDVVGDAVVRLPGGGGYRVLDLSVATTTRRGEARVLPPWSTTPQLPDFAEISLRGDPPLRLAGVEVEFRRTNGIQVTGFVGGSYRATTNADGWVALFGNAVRPVEVGVLVGDLYIYVPARGDTTVHRDVRIPATAAYGNNSIVRGFGAGPNLTYHFEVNFRGSGAHAEGVRVDFQKVSGIEVELPVWSKTTDGNGRVWFPGRALQRGTLIGDLTITPAPPSKTYTRRVELPTFEADGGNLYPILGIGPGLPYYLVIRNNGAPMKGVEVEFQRTSGIDVTPSRFTATTNDTGIVSLTPAPASEGEVVGDVTVRPPAPFASFTVRGIRMQARDADVPGGRVLIGEWDVTSPPAALRGLGGLGGLGVLGGLGGLIAPGHTALRTDGRCALDQTSPRRRDIAPACWRPSLALR